MEHNAIMVLREGKLKNILKDKFDESQYINFINNMIPKCDIGKIDYKLFSAILIAVNNMTAENNMTNLDNNNNNYHRYKFLEIGYIYNEIFKVKDTVKDVFKVKSNKHNYCFSNNTANDGYKRVTIARKKDIYIGKDYNDDIYKSSYEWNRTLKNAGLSDLCNIDLDKVTLDDFIKESRSKIYNPIKEFIIDGNFIDVYNEKMTIDHYHRSIKNAFNLINNNDYLVSLYFD